MSHNPATATIHAPGSASAAFPATSPGPGSDQDMAWALERLGCTPQSLSAQQMRQLDLDGFLLLPGHLDDALLTRLRTAYDRLMHQKYGSPGASCDPAATDYWHHEHGTRRLADLVSEDAVFDGLYCDPVILAGVSRIFAGPFKLDSINAREALPGHGHQALHRDHPRTPDGQEPGVNTAWLLDDFTPLNGPTRVVPGSHLWVDGPESLAHATLPHPQEQPVLAQAGAVLIFRNTLWHGGTQNCGISQRRVIHVSYRRRDQDLGERAQRLRIRKHTWQRVSPAARWILDVQD